MTLMESTLIRALKDVQTSLKQLTTFGEIESDVEMGKASEATGGETPDRSSTFPTIVLRTSTYRTKQCTVQIHRGPARSHVAEPFSPIIVTYRCRQSLVWYYPLFSNIGRAFCHQGLTASGLHLLFPVPSHLYLLFHYDIPLDIHDSECQRSVNCASRLHSSLMLAYGTIRQGGGYWEGGGEIC